MEHVYIAFITAVVFFICKQLLNRKSNVKDFNKQLLRDCLLIFIIVYATSYYSNYYMKTEMENNAEIFTSLPGF
jgi:putative effector of murein hydrolase